MEPIAIIGIGCRFPQANSPEAFWRLLQSGDRAISTVPTERWESAHFYDPDPRIAGKMSSCRGGFLKDVDQFDASFFGISDAEAAHIDPQQRLFLEVAWEALEHAGVAPMGLGGSATGVFTGLCTIDYHRLLYKDFDCIGPHSGTGTTMSITANRLSYLLDLRGPSMAVDAACSSSLVAVHLAMQSLRSQETNLGIAGGVNLILSPDSMISSSQTGLLSAKGECRPFDANADGYVRGEGCGVVVLKRLNDAIADGDNILAVIRGSAVNQDGLSNSMVAPNGRAQQALIQQSLANSSVTPAEVDYVEAHAVGTPLGDAIEFKALRKVLAAGRKEACTIGSLKPSIGHLEAASGIASLIKVVLALQHGEIPPQLNFERANDYVDLNDGLFEILAAGKPWQRGSRPRIAGVSTFGFGGTNAHLVIEETPVGVRLADSALYGDRSHHVFAMTAKSKTALRALAQRYSDFLLSGQGSMAATSQPETSLADICFAANTGRTHFAERLCLVSHSRSHLQQQLAQFAEGEETLLASQFITGKAQRRKRPKIVFYFPEPATAGTLALGNHLYKTQPVFRESFDLCSRLVGRQLRLTASFATEPAVARVSGFAASYALSTLWQTWGIVPRAVMGRGLGEYVAACVSGLLDIREVLPLLSLPLTTPLWSAASLTYKLPHLPLLSAATAAISAPISPSSPHAFTEVRVNAYSPLLQQAVSQFVSASDHPDTYKKLPLTGLSGYDIALCMGVEGSVFGCLSKAELGAVKLLAMQDGIEIWPQLLSHLGELFVSGAEVDWAVFDAGYCRQKMPLPTYPFERSSYWFASRQVPTQRPVKNNAMKSLYYAERSRAINNN